MKSIEVHLSKCLLAVFFMVFDTSKLVPSKKSLATYRNHSYFKKYLL